MKAEDKIVRDLAIRIRQLRHEKGWSQERLAEAVGMDRSYVGGIEIGKRNPSLKNLVRIARALEVSMVDLFAAGQVVGPPRRRS